MEENTEHKVVLYTKENKKSFYVPGKVFRFIMNEYVLLKRAPTTEQPPGFTFMFFLLQIGSELIFHDSGSKMCHTEPLFRILDLKK